MQVEGCPIALHAGQKIEIVLGESHQALNLSNDPVRFLVTSCPPSHGHRVEDDPEAK